MAASAPKPEVSYVTYFIPSDGDAEEHPNVFVVRKPPRALTLADVVSGFPLPGEYLFRAKFPFAKAHGAWVSRCPALLLLARTRVRHPLLTPHTTLAAPLLPKHPSVAGPQQPRGGGARL